MTYRSRIPVEAKVLACLRIFGRGSCAPSQADDIKELTANMIADFVKVKGMAVFIYPLFVKKPEGNYLKDVLALYARLRVDLPGAFLMVFQMSQ